MDNLISYCCPICGNTDINSIGHLNGKPYCRKCISFKGEEVEHKRSYPKKAPIHLLYELSPEQKELSDKLVKNYKNGIDSLVFAVCGAGKTEIVLQTIKAAIEGGNHVGFAIPRKDVVIEIYSRLKEIFKTNKVVSVYGGHHKELEGDIVVLTTHQLFRYNQYFSLLIVDELDAFPYKNNSVLKSILNKSYTKNCIFLTATPDWDVLSEFKKPKKEILNLDVRFHKHPIPVPVFYIKKWIFRYTCLLFHFKNILKSNKPLFVFTPTIEMCEKIYKLLSIFSGFGGYVHSKINNRDAIISKFKKKQLKYLVCTSVLERGVAVSDLQVIVFDADHYVYDTSTLIQISGRVGRKKEAPDGQVIFIASKITKSMEEAKENVIQSNKVLQNML